MLSVRTVGVGGQGPDEKLVRLYRRLPDLRASIYSTRTKGTGRTRTSVGVGAGWLQGDGLFPGIDGVIVLLWTNWI